MSRQKFQRNETKSTNSPSGSTHIHLHTARAKCTNRMVMVVRFVECSSIFYLLIRFIRCHGIRLGATSWKLTCWMVSRWSFTFPRNVWFWRTFFRAPAESTCSPNWQQWDESELKRKHTSNEHQRQNERKNEKKKKRKLFVTELLLAPKSDKLFRKIMCSLSSSYTNLLPHIST